MAGMNAIRQLQALNKRELENVVPPEASWHADYRDTAYIYIGSLPSDLSEGDILTIFSQYGEPVHLNLVRDKETGKSKGFAFLKYEDQRSTDLAVDNLGGATILGRMIRVDHARYKRKEEEGLEDNVAAMTVGETEEHDDEDPMKEYLIQEKREEVAKALERLNKRKEHRSDGTEKEDKHGHRHRHHRYHNRRHRCDRSSSPGREKQFSRHERSKSPSQLKERRHHRDRRDRS
ncbi:conserved hypothetical protein [Histoplasma mississippiense (nom. inval.)]|uniref:conserved hypothetical protein n=1 Tax=Ajellomyces capsulatus (strain NAm1 / WU24) TaxID=2059318 RepID=UPI000157B59B|nr:conserved hypothetical protein [Histoplasma mississippiense (nom. inval.)]EDN02855.1 conserved hypothetical protein [Histoplasma mississippiense (nom. inval.)]